jgi:hypothetical protein
MTIRTADLLTRQPCPRAKSANSVFAATSRQGIFGHQNSMPRLSTGTVISLTGDLESI